MSSVDWLNQSREYSIFDWIGGIVDGGEGGFIPEFPYKNMRQQLLFT